MLRTVALLAALGGAAGSIHFTREVTQAPSWASGTITIAGDACKSSDKYGSNDCTLNWGQSYTGAIDATLGQDIPSGSLVADMKIDGLIPFDATCKICGENCTIKIPIVGKTFSFAMPPCPIAKGPMKKSITEAVPAAPSGLPKTSVKGTLTVKDGSGAAIAAVTIDASVDTSLRSAANATLQEFNCGQDCANCKVAQTWAEDTCIMVGNAPPYPNSQKVHVANGVATFMSYDGDSCSGKPTQVSTQALNNCTYVTGQIWTKFSEAPPPPAKAQ